MIWAAWITGGRREPGSIQPWRNYLRRILYERDCSFWSNNFHEPWIICKFRQILFGSPNILRPLPRLCLPGIFGPLLWGQGSPKQGLFIKEPPACRKNEPTGTLPDFSFRCLFLYVSRFGFVSTLAFVQTNILCGWCLRHSVWLKAPWVVGIFWLEKLSWRWYFWLGRNRSDEWVSDATICLVVYIPNAGLQLIPTDWVCCFRCRLLTRGNLQNIKHGLLVRHHDTRKWMHKPECCFFFGGGRAYDLFSPKFSGGGFGQLQVCHHLALWWQNQSTAMIYHRITLQGMSQYLSWNVCPTIYPRRRYVSSQEGKTPNISGDRSRSSLQVLR